MIRRDHDKTLFLAIINICKSAGLGFAKALFPGKETDGRAGRRTGETSMSDPTPRVVEISLSKHYAFMYENFVIATQNAVYLLLGKQGDVVDVLHFDSPQVRYGSPNDEARGGHPLAAYGLGFYGLFEVEHSPWIQERITANRVHHRHEDALFDGLRHYIACFKDVMLEVTCHSFRERQMSVSEIESLLEEQLNYLER